MMLSDRRVAGVPNNQKKNEHRFALLLVIHHSLTVSATGTSPSAAFLRRASAAVAATAS